MRRLLPWIGLAGALALVGAGAAVGHSRARERERSPLPSASSTGPHGLAAARLFLQATGRAATRIAAADERPPPGAVLLLAAPRAALDDADAAALVAHARAGGTVVWMAGPVRQPALEHALSLRATAARGPRVAEPIAPHPLLAGLRLPAGAGRVEGGSPGTLPVLAAGDAVAGASVPAGAAGEVLVLSGTEPLENERLGEADAAALLVRLAARGPVVFDERWLAARGAPPASRAGLAAAALQAALAAAVLLAARGRRLGAVRPPPPGAEGRTARDYLASLAVLYRRAGAEEELARATWQRARRALERRTGIAARLPAAEAAPRLARRSPAAAAALLRGEAALRSGPGALLAVCRAADDLRGLGRA